MIASAAMSSTDSIISASRRWLAFCTGAKVTPQLPINAVVTPWKVLDFISGSQPICASICVCGSMNPGETILSVASMVRAAATPFKSPIRAMRSPSMATSALKPSAPVPSITVPPLIIRSWSIELLLKMPDGNYRSDSNHTSRRVRPEGLMITGVLERKFFKGATWLHILNNDKHILLLLRHMGRTTIVCYV
jgi:hypothetical protein